MFTSALVTFDTRGNLIAPEHSSANIMKSSRVGDKEATSQVPFQKEGIPPPIDWWTIARRVGILMIIVYGSRFVGKIMKHRGLSFLAPSEYDPGAL
jgi:hypothetical protein